VLLNEKYEQNDGFLSVEHSGQLMNNAIVVGKAISCCAMSDDQLIAAAVVQGRVIF
jgi:hypothetical protein